MPSHLSARPAGENRCGEGQRGPRGHVLYVVDSLDVGGTETQMVQVARRLGSYGYEVTVACLRAGGPLTEALAEKGIRILEFPKRRSMLSFAAVYQLLRLVRHLRREGIGVVHAHDLWANLMGVPAAWLARTPVILASQRNLAHVDWYTPFRRKLLRVIFRLSTAVIANSAAVRALLLEKFRVPADKVHVFHNGVDLDRFDDVERDRQKIDSRLSEETKLVVHIANMNSEVKGQAVLIEAARTVCTAIPLARFVLVGDGPLRGVYERRVKELELEDRVLFLGRRQDIAEILACGDLFAFPSFAEGMPNSVLEAGASGLPIVATPVGGIPEIVTHERTGLLVPPRDPEALAAAILRVLEDPGLASSLSRACQTWVRSQFSFDRLIRDLSGIYDGQKGTQ